MLQSLSKLGRRTFTKTVRKRTRCAALLKARPTRRTRRRSGRDRCSQMRLVYSGGQTWSEGIAKVTNRGAVRGEQTAGFAVMELLTLNSCW